MSEQEIFKNKFNLPQEGFLKPIDLVDTEVGFSVYKEREKKGFKSLFRVYIKNEILNNNDGIKPVIITAVYGKEEDNGITISSSAWKREINWPVELSSESDFFYNIQEHYFLYKNKKFDGIDILKKVDGRHTKTTKPLRDFG